MKNEVFHSEERCMGLRAELLDQHGRPVGQLEVLLSYDYLMQEILKEGWMVAQMAYLASHEVKYFAHSSPAIQAGTAWEKLRSPWS